MEKIRIKDASFGHMEAGWRKTNESPSDVAPAGMHNLVSGSENTVWRKGELIAIGTVDTWGRQDGCAFAFHESHA